MKVKYKNVKGGIILLVPCKDLNCWMCSNSKNCLTTMDGNGNTVRESIRIEKQINIRSKRKRNK